MGIGFGGTKPLLAAPVTEPDRVGEIGLSRENAPQNSFGVKIIGRTLVEQWG
jgi:hypothetical protein